MSGLPSPPHRVAVQGEPGCFSHAAAVDLYGELILVPCRDFTDLFAAVEDGRADRGMVPVENALAGAVVENLDLMASSGLHAVAECYVRVEMCLVGRPGSLVDDLSAAGSHPVALRQCRDFFAVHPHIRPVVSHDTAGAIRDLMAGESGFDAAIGPALAAELYGGEVLRRGIEDHTTNFTRFLVVAREATRAPTAPGGDLGGPVAPSGSVAGKASLAFTLPHRPGALHSALGLFAEEQLDLTRLESRPIPGRPWEYRFYLDVRTGDGAGFTRALDRLGAFAPEVQLLGRYAEADVPGVDLG